MVLRSSLKRTLLILAFLAVGAFITQTAAEVYFAVGKHTWIFQDRARSTVGATEREVIQKMGPPRFVIAKGELKGRSLDHPWKDMNFRPIPTRPVTNKVLLYMSAWSAAYVFIGPNGRVEQVETAGT